MPSRILLIEDEPGLLLTLGDRLRSEGYVVQTAADGASGYQKALEEAFDLIVLDVMLPGKNGLDVCRDLRAQGMPIPILMLTARGQTTDKVLGLKLGADDYLAKPFEMVELLARLEALLRRASQPRAAETPFKQIGNIRIDFRRTEVTREGKLLPLSAREFKLLRYLAEHAGQTVSREELLKEVWGYSFTPSTRTVDVHIAWLRQKLENDPKEPELILTVQGMGYKLSA